MSGRGVEKSDRITFMKELHSTKILLANKWPTDKVLDSLQRGDIPNLIAFIKIRHNERFFAPIKFLRNAPRNNVGYGFAIMALCSLLIETIQSYKDGFPTTNSMELGRLRKLKDVPKQYGIPVDLTVDGKTAFKDFFEHFSDLFPNLKGEEFYENVRNGLLHQAQTKNDWTIKIGRAQLFEPVKKIIDRNLFADNLEKAFKKYLDELGSKHWESHVWQKASRKIWWLIRISHGSNFSPSSTALN